jgi:hypothetical protein
VVLFEMQQVSAEMIQGVENFDYDQKFEDVKNADFLWLCSTVFSNCGNSIRNPQIMCCTNDDTPHIPDSEEYLQSSQKAKDLRQLKLDFKLFPMAESFYGIFFTKISSSSCWTENIRFLFRSSTMISCFAEC